MKIIGYGEDSLTYWALSDNTQLEIILKTVGDSSSGEDCFALYRPSFGRGKGGFGEFDAILVSPKRVYLIESKWRIERGAVTIYPYQIKRHKTFKKYIKKFKNGVEPTTDTILGRNLLFALQKIASKNPTMKTQDILLFFAKKELGKIRFDKNANYFKRVNLELPEHLKLADNTSAIGWLDLT